MFQTCGFKSNYPHSRGWVSMCQLPDYSDELVLKTREVTVDMVREIIAPINTFDAGYCCYPAT